MSSGQSDEEGEEEDVALVNGSELNKSKRNIQFRMRQGHQRMHKSLLSSVGRYTLILSIVLVLSYVGILRPPHPFDIDNNDDDMLRSSVWRKIFSFNGFSFFFSACGLLLCASLTFSPSTFTYAHSWNHVEEETSVHLRRLATDMPKVFYMAMFLSLSLIFCAAAYISAGLATTAEEKSSTRLAVVIPSALGSLVFLQAIFIFARDFFDFWKEVLVSDVELWETMKAGTIFGGIWGWYVEQGVYKLGVASTQQHICEKGEEQG